MNTFERMRSTRMGWVPLAKSLAPPVMWQAVFKALVIKDIPDADRYQPFYSPWLAPEFVALYEDARPYTLVPIASCYTLANCLRQAFSVPGEVLEAGVFQGGTARMMNRLLGPSPAKQLYLFDSFDGMAKVDEALDRHRRSDFADTSLEGVRRVVGDAPHIHYRKGWIPQTFEGLDDLKLAFAHIDVDLHDSIVDSLAFVYPRLSSGGFIVVDDYGYASCPGARRAVEAFFADKPEQPLAMMTGQALIAKL